jgi:hypothetical protein
MMKATQVEEAPHDIDQSGTQRGGEKKVTLASSWWNARKENMLKALEGPPQAPYL